MNGLHSRKMIWLAIVGSATMLMAGCHDSDVPDKKLLADRTSQDMPSCSPFALNDPVPAKGTMYEYGILQKDNPSPVRLYQTMRGHHAGQQAFRERLYNVFKDSFAIDDIRKYDPVETSVGGILSWEKRTSLMIGEYRYRTFGKNPAKAIAGLSFGDSVTIPSVEKSRFDGKEKSISEPVKLTWLGCKTLPILDKPVNTSVYQVQITARAYRRASGEDKPLTTVYKVYYWAEQGWWVRNETSGGTLQLAAIHTR